MLFDAGYTGMFRSPFDIFYLTPGVDGPGGINFGWEGEVEPPMVLHRRSRPGGFPQFPFFPGGPHDPLRGMSIPFYQLKSCLH
jgi:hypothetical protein